MAFTGQLTGHLGRDPELRYLENGSIVANFTVAVRQNKRKGEEQPPRWVKVAVWGKAAEYVGNYVKKGDGVICMGRIETPELFTDRNGQQRLSEVFTAENIEKWSERRGDAQPQQQAPPPAAAAAPAARAQHPAYAAAGHQPRPLQEDDDIPF